MELTERYYCVDIVLLLIGEKMFDYVDDKRI